MGSIQQMLELQVIPLSCQDPIDYLAGQTQLEDAICDNTQFYADI